MGADALHLDQPLRPNLLQERPQGVFVKPAGGLGQAGDSGQFHGFRGRDEIAEHAGLAQHGFVVGLKLDDE